LRSALSGPPVGVRAVGHPEQALADVGSPDARSAEIRRPDGVTRSFQVIAYSVEPRERSAACNLFPKDHDRAALADEPPPNRPEVPLIGEAAALAGGAERLAGTRSGPAGPAVGPTGEAERVGPATDPGEEVALVESAKVFWSDILDAPFVHGAGG
jgi:hypothetical protein